MGYGESLAQLRDRANCQSYVSDKNLTVNQMLPPSCWLEEEDIEEFIVDENSLRTIAQTTKMGRAKFPKTSQEVIDSLNAFLTTLREYEITYQQPEADRASSHQTKVIVNKRTQGLNNTASAPQDIKMNRFFYRSLSIVERLGIFIGTIAVGIVGFKQFNNWSKQLKEQSRPRN
jgi:hypothetical protein